MLEKYYNKYGYAVYREITESYRYFMDKADYALAERTVKRYMPKIDNVSSSAEKVGSMSICWECDKKR